VHRGNIRDLPKYFLQQPEQAFIAIDERVPGRHSLQGNRRFFLKSGLHPFLKIDTQKSTRL